MMGVSGGFVSAMTSDTIARLINEDQIQILINLNGYTKGSRNEIFTLQPAPIQVSYMGCPGTTSASYIQYLVTDEFVSPTRFAHMYSEKLVHLPHCYFVNVYKQSEQKLKNKLTCYFGSKDALRNHLRSKTEEIVDLVDMA
ncbi:probable UDP-N-acetylglucosamine--peptide N-acetylglucosaminyltransferase SEC [Tanacetum coccineum]